jgi:mycothiol synthase
MTEQPRITVRRCVPNQDDATRADIANRVSGDRDDYVPQTVEDIRRWDKSPYEQDRHRFIAELGGIPVGAGFAYADPEQRGTRKGFMAGPGVVPEHRRKGVGRALAYAILGDLRRRGMEHAEIQGRDRPDSNGFLAALGFKVTRSFSEMRRSLDTVPHGLGESVRTELALVEPTDANLAIVLDIENEALKEDSNHRPRTPREFRFFFTASAEHGSVLRVLLARLAGSPVGYVGYGYNAREIARLGRKRGGLWGLSVLQPFRNRGIAKALMLAGMKNLGAEGMEEVGLNIDDTNPTNARLLYERLGFELVHRDLVYSLDLSGTRT